MLVLLLTGCGHNAGKIPSFTGADISGVITRMTDIMVHDITNPPLAARFFAYATLAGYEVVAEYDSTCTTFQKALNGRPAFQPPKKRYEAWQLAALLAMMETSAKLQPSGQLMKAYEQSFLDSLQSAGCAASLLQEAKAYAGQVSAQVLKYAKSDSYNKISNYPRYTPVAKEGCWYPTPPAYISAVEPYFNTIRSFTLDSSQQFKPPPPIPFSAAKGSAFYELMLRNYRDTLATEHAAIAAFWDCNPFALQDNGHLLMSQKKISPGAHWLGITGIACAKAGKSFSATMQVYTVVAIGLTDAFICCWDEKYRSNRIRPETAIRQYIDPEWKPFLQTPPFPEYVSGHSVASATAAVLLSHFFGNDFAYTDNVEVDYHLPPRHYASFMAAANEAAISRFYGGIHFMDAIENGVAQGRRIGDWVYKKLLVK